MPDRLTALCLALLLAVPHCIRLDDEVFASRLQGAGDTASLTGEEARVANPPDLPADNCGATVATAASDGRPQGSHRRSCGRP